MKVAIFYDSAKLKEVKEITSKISAQGCAVAEYDSATVMQCKMKEDAFPQGIMEGITHVLFVCGKASLAKVAFVFFAGYSLGAHLPILLVSQSGDDSLPEPWLHLVTTVEFQTLDSYFAQEVQRFNENEVRELAKNKLLEKGYSVFNANYVQAVKNNETEVAKLFIEAGFSPSASDSLGTPVLSLAVRERHLEMVSLLLASGADVNATSKDRNYTALMDAAQIGEVKIVQLLLKNNADPNTQSKDGQTALILAVGRQDVDVIESLLQSGGDYSLKDGMGMSALDYVNLFRNEKILSLFEGKGEAGK